MGSIGKKEVLGNEIDEIMCMSKYVIMNLTIIYNYNEKRKRFVRLRIHFLHILSLTYVDSHSSMSCIHMYF